MITAETDQSRARTRPATQSLAAAASQLIASWLPLAVLLLAVLAIGLLTLVNVPRPFVDEAWNANRSWALMHTGQAFGTLDAGVFNKYDGYWTYFPLLASAIHVPFLWLFGPSLFAMRFASLLFGLLLLFVIYIIGRRLYGPGVGLLAAVLTSLSLAFVYSSHFGRHDIIVAAMGYGAIALYLTDRSEGFPARALLAGLLVGLTLDVHMNGAVYGPVIAGLFFVDYRWSALRNRRFWSFVAGGCAGVAYFIAIHILPYPQTYFKLFALGNGSGRTPAVFTLDGAVWLTALHNVFDLIGSLRVPFVILALVLFIRTHRDADKKLLIISVGLLLVFEAVVRTLRIFYNIYVSPGLDLLVAAFLVQVLRARLSRPIYSYIRTLLVWGFVFLYLMLGLQVLTGFNFSSDYQRTLDRIRAVVPPGKSVMGPQTYWFGLTDHNYLSWEQLVYYQGSVPGSTVADAFRSLHPDYFMIDEFTLGFMKEPPANDQAGPRLYLPEDQVNGFLDQHAHMVADMETDGFGRIRIYQIDWH